MFYRERAGGTYRVLPYALSEFLVELPYLLAQACLYSLLVYWCAARARGGGGGPGRGRGARDQAACCAPRAAAPQAPGAAPGRTRPCSPGCLPARRTVGFQADAGKLFWFLLIMVRWRGEGADTQGAGADPEPRWRPVSRLAGWRQVRPQPRRRTASA